MSKKRLIFYAAIAIAVIWIRIDMERNSLERGDRVRVTEQTFGGRSYKVLQELDKACYHEDQIGVLQFLYDERARYLSPGNQGRVIMDGGEWVEIRFDDDGLRNWWVKRKAIDKVD